MEFVRIFALSLLALYVSLVFLFLHNAMYSNQISHIRKNTEIGKWERMPLQSPRRQAAHPLDHILLATLNLPIPSFTEILLNRYSLNFTGKKAEEELNYVAEGQQCKDLSVLFHSTHPDVSELSLLVERSLSRSYVRSHC